VRRIHTSDAVALSALLIAIALYFWPWLSLDRAFFQVDIGFMDHPLRVHAFRMMRGGSFPLWTDHLLAGFPLFAEGQAAILYPFSWLYLVLPAEAALSLFVVLHFALLGGFTYLFLRARALSAPAALFGALTLVFSSFMLVEHILLGFLSVVAWLPLLLWLVQTFVRKSSLPHLIAAAVVVALMHLAGDALGTLLAVSVAASYALFGSPSAPCRRRLTAFVLPIVVGTLLAAVQLLPTIEFLQESTRREPVAARAPTANFVAPIFALTAIYPNFQGESFARYAASPIPGWEETLFFFIGWTPLFLVAFGSGRGRDPLFWTVTAAAAVFLSVRSFVPLSRYFWALPFFGLFRWPARILLWYALGMSVLAADGFEALRRATAVPSREFRARWSVVLTLGLVGLALFWWLHDSVAAVDPATGCCALEELLRSRWSDLILLVVNWIGFLTVVVLLRRGWIRDLTAAALAFLSLGAGALANQKPQGVPPKLYQSPPDTVLFLKQHLGAGARILSFATWDDPTRPTDGTSMALAAAPLPPNFHLLFDLRAAGAFDMEHTTTLRRNREALLLPGSRVWQLLGLDALVWPRPPDEETNQRALEATKHGYSRCFSGTATIFCRDAPLSRAFLVHQYRVLGKEEPWDFIQRNDPDLRQTALLEKEPKWSAMPGATTSEEEVRFVKDEPTNVELDVCARLPSVLVLAESDYPGWKATIDGQSSEILLADGFVRAVAIPTGRHRVGFRFEPQVVRVGAMISLVTLLLSATALGVGHRRAATP
jgi:hypothetical protein